MEKEVILLIITVQPLSFCDRIRIYLSVSVPALDGFLFVLPARCVYATWSRENPILRGNDL